MGNDAVPPCADTRLPVRPRLSDAEQAVLRTLVTSGGRVMGRRELARQSDLTEQSERRCDAIMVTLRRALGDGSIVTVRRRGWRLAAIALPIATSLCGEVAS